MVNRDESFNVWKWFKSNMHDSGGGVRARNEISAYFSSCANYFLSTYFARKTTMGLKQGKRGRFFFSRASKQYHVTRIKGRISDDESKWMTKEKAMNKIYCKSFCIRAAAAAVDGCCCGRCVAMSLDPNEATQTLKHSKIDSFRTMTQHKIVPITIRNHTHFAWSHTKEISSVRDNFMVFCVCARERETP